jgi:hypothetical protein
MKKILLLTLLLAAAMTTAHSQSLPAATTYTVVVKWPSLPPACTAATTCTFALYRLSAACPTIIATTTGWTLAATSTAQALTVTDPNPPAGSICEIIVPKQGTAVGPISNAIPITIPPSITPVNATATVVAITITVTVP